MTAKIRLIVLIGIFSIFSQNIFAWELPNNSPNVVADWLKDTPKDTVVSIAYSEISNSNALGTAMDYILKKRYQIVQDIMRDYTASSNVNASAALSFQENLIVALSRMPLNGITVYNWEIISYSNGRDEVSAMAAVVINKNNFINDLSKAAAEVKRAVPAMASFDFDRYMNTAYNRMVSQRLQILQ